MDSIAELIDALRCLPGVGPKSASRMAYHLLKHHRQKGLRLADALKDAMQHVIHCQTCNNFSVTPLCQRCQDPTRDRSLLCIVDSPSDIVAIEQTQMFKGRYFVLLGKISPLEGLGPEEIGLPRLQTLLNAEPIAEVILALSPSIEGQTTIHFIQEMLKGKTIKITQLAHGIPSGGELEFLDGRTIAAAFNHRAHLVDAFV